jgi:drug/metabolite transporter (DMT)-like permease
VIGRKTGAAPISEARRPEVPPLALGLLLSIGVLWGLNWPAMKLALGQLSPWTFRAFSVWTAGVLLLVIARVAGDRSLPARSTWRDLVILSLVNVTGWHVLSAYGIVLVPGGRAAIIAYTMPLWAALLSSWILEERIAPVVWLALTLGLAGVALLVLPEIERFGAAPQGALFMIGAAIAWAMGTVLIKRRAWGVGMLALTGWQLLLGGIPIVAVWLLQGAPLDLHALTPGGAAATLYAALVGLVFCFAAFNKVVSLVPASLAAVGTLLIPCVGLVSSHLLLGEPLGWREALALASVVTGLGLVLRPRR